MGHCGTSVTRRQLAGVAEWVTAFVLMVTGMWALAVLPARASSAPFADMPATATLKIAARVTLIATPNRPTVNDILTLTARVAEIAGNPFPATGTVTFFDGSRRLGAGTLAAATASWAGRLREGRQRLSATYTGDAYYTRGQSPRLDVIVTVAAAGASAIRPSQPGTRPASTGPTGIGVSLVLATTAILAGLFLLAQARRGRH